MTRMEKWVLLGAASFSLLSCGTIMLYAKFDPPTSAFYAPLQQLAYYGSRLRIDLAPSACADDLVGKLSCTIPYVAAFDRASNSWHITGYDSVAGRLVARMFDNAPAQPGNISILGVLAQFDNSGVLTMNGKPVGKIQVVIGRDPLQ